MSRDSVAADFPFRSALRTFRRPWPILGVGLACTVIGLALSQTTLVPLRLLFLGAGILLAGIAVARRLQTASWELEERVESAGVLGTSFFVVLLAYLSTDAQWDSALLFLQALLIVTLAGSFIVLLPRMGRRIAAVAFVLFHFCGILSAVTSVPPPRSDAPPWISTFLWSYFYRHYLFFTYFTNAYHFYSPDPGPATLVWFHIEYEDGSVRWKKIPNRDESPVGLYHQRMLAAAESTMNNMNGPPLINQEQIRTYEQKLKRPYELLPGIPHDTWDEIVRRRRAAAELFKFVDPQDGRPAPLYPVFELPGQSSEYAEPLEFSRRLIASFARHVAHSEPRPVKTVRVYRVVHTLMTPRELYEGKDPLEPTRFVPFYMGKYDPDGKLLDPQEPFLYWHVPIIRVSRRYPEPGTYVPPEQGGPMLIPRWEPTADDPGKIINFVEIHATQSDRFQPETLKKK
jgi:hypothetical protein